ARHGRGGRNRRPGRRAIQGQEDGRGRRAEPVRGAAAPLYARATVRPAGECHRRPASHRLGLLRTGGRPMSAAETPVVEGRAIVQDYHVPGGMFARARTVRALKGVSFKVEKGKTLAIVGESGSGKSTLARVIALIDAPTTGELMIEG